MIVAKLVTQAWIGVSADVPSHWPSVGFEAADEPTENDRTANGRGDGLEGVDVEAVGDVEVRPRAPAKLVEEAFVGAGVNVA